MKTNKTILFLCVKDIMVLTGKCKATACRLRAAIRKHFNKPLSLKITVEDFCAFTGISEEKVNGMLG